MGCQQLFEIGGGVLAALLGGGAAPRRPYDYTAFRQAKPASLLVLPPLNQSPEVKGGIGVMSQVRCRWPKPATTCCRCRWSRKPSARTA